MFPGYFLHEFEPPAEMGLDLCSHEKLLVFALLCLALVAAGLDPLSRRAAAELPQILSCIQLSKAWLVSVNRNKWL